MQPASWKHGIVVQRVFTKRLQGFQHLPYMQRLKKAGLLTLECRRLHADLILCYKILRGLIETTVNQFFIRDLNSITRGHEWKLKATRIPRLNVSHHFYSFRTINVWNTLKSETVCSNSISSFKKLLYEENLTAFLIIKYTVLN